jgi:hypothetical protein
MMFKHTIILTLLILAPLLSHPPSARGTLNGRDRPDFSGTWMLDKERSKLSEAYPLRKGGDQTLTITQQEPEVKIAQKSVLPGRERTREFVYYTDGRGESNSNWYSYEVDSVGSTAAPEYGGEDKIRSKTTWEGNKIVSRYRTYVATRRTGMMIVDGIEFWSLSKDSLTLTHTTVLSSGSENGPLATAFRQEVKRVFKRV